MREGQVEEVLRRCGRCEVLLPITDFNWRRRSKGQHDNYCRACRADYKREHYRTNRQRYIAQAGELGKRVARERTRYLIKYFEAHPCSDCGEDDPVVLEFDHLGDKAFSIGHALKSYNWQRILDEIEKCEVVCANCHRRRTGTRGDHLRIRLTTGHVEASG